MYVGLLAWCVLYGLVWFCVLNLYMFACWPGVCWLIMAFGVVLCIKFIYVGLLAWCMLACLPGLLYMLVFSVVLCIEFICWLVVLVYVVLLASCVVYIDFWCGFVY